MPQVRVGWRANTGQAQATQSVSTLLASLYGAWNGDAATNELEKSIYNVWNGELVGTTESNTLDSGVYLYLNGATQSSTIGASIYGVWNGDGNANDSVGSNNGTIMGGLTYSAGKIGNAFQFNGTNAYVRLADNSMNLTGDFTISAWVYVTSGGPQTILSNEYYSGTTIKGWGIYLDNLSAGQTGRFLQFIVYRNTTSDYTGYQASLHDLNPNSNFAGLANNSWSHIAIVRKSGVDTFIYINGEKVSVSLTGASTDRTLDPLYNTTQYVTIGADVANSTGTSFANYMKSGSKIDGLSAWNRALDSFEITQMYNNGVGYQYPFPNFLNTGDLIGGKNGAMINGASHSTGYTMPSALSLDGVNDYYQFPDNIIDSVKTEFSISFWMKTSATSGWIFGEQTTVNNNTVTNEIDRGISLVYSGGGVFTFRSGNNGSDFNLVSNLSSRYAVGKFSMAEWNHVTLTYKQNVGVKFYFNGVLINSSTTANPLSIRTSRNIFRIGSAIIYYNGSTQKAGFFSGQIDSFTIRNREVSQSEVSLMYNGYNPISYPYSNKTVYGIYDSFSSINGTYSNVSGAGIKLVDGKLNKSFWFDGASSIALPENSLNTLVSGDFSISFWVYATNGNGAGVSPFTYTSVNGTTINGFEMRLSGWIPQFVMYNNNTNANSVLLASSTNIVQNTWNHVVITRKRGTRSKLYLNGVLVASNTSTADPVISGNFNGCIGHNKMTGFNYVLSAGSMMDSITTWRREILADEAVQLYNSGTGAQYPFSGTFSSAGNVLGMDNGTLMNGCSLTTGKIGQAFTFDGVNDYVSLPDNSLNFTGDFSVSAWIYVSNLSGEKYIISNVNGNALDVNIGWCFGVFDNKVSFWVYPQGSSYTGWLTNTTILLNTWYHVSVTKKPSQSPLIYINGTLSSTSLYNNSMASSINPIYSTTTYPNTKTSIGVYRYNNGSSAYAYFNGKIDSLNVWQKELTQSEITELYNSGNGKQIAATPIVQAGLVLNLDASRKSSYPGTGTTWTDISGSGNNGTMVNGPVFGTASGGQITFDGVDDYINCGTLGNFGSSLSSNSITVEFAFKSNYNTGIRQFGTINSGSATLLVINFNRDENDNYSSGKTTFSLRDNNGLTLGVSMNANIYTNNYFVVAVSRNVSTNQVKFYVNGVPVNVTVGGVGFNSNPVTFSNFQYAFTVGALNNRGSIVNYINSSIPFFRMYNKLLTDSEVLQNFNATKSRFGL